MSTPQDSTAPAPILNSDPAVVAGKDHATRFSERVVAWFKALSPSGATEYDTGWVGVPLSAGGTGSCSIRRVGRLVSLRMGVTRNWSANTTTAVSSAIPAELRPPSTTACAVAFNSGEVGWGWVNTSGVVEVRRPTAGSVAVQVAATWLI